MVDIYSWCIDKIWLRYIVTGIENSWLNIITNVFVKQNFTGYRDRIYSYTGRLLNTNTEYIGCYQADQIQILYMFIPRYLIKYK